PAHPWPITGATLMRPREGFSPTTPQQAAGMRIEPPPSVPSASGPIPAATCPAAPPLEPPALNSGFHGLRAGGQSPPSVVGRPPSSGVVVLPSRMPPASRSRTASSASARGRKFSKFLEPIVVRMSRVQVRSLSEYGTPYSGIAPAAAAP